MRGVVGQFPNVYENLDLAVLLRAYREGPARIEAVLRGLSDAELRLRPRGPGRWSAIEIALHVADSELVGGARVRMVFAQSGAVLPGYDQDVWTRVFDYQSAPEKMRAAALRQFKAVRESTVSVFERASAADWDRSGVHPEYGPVTLRNLLELYADHSERHVEQILDIRRRIGRGIACEMVLRDRLY